VSWTRSLAHRALRYATAGSGSQFANALRKPESVQRTVLSKLLMRNRECEIGKRYGFQSIHSAEEFQHRVPVCTYDELSPFIERMKLGETGVLTSEKVTLFELSSGSSSSAKFIPYTESLSDEFSSAVNPWLSDLYTSIPQLRSGSIYWSVTPSARRIERTHGGIRIGFADDTEYFGSFGRMVLSRIFAVPPVVARIADVDASLYATLRFLVQARDLSLISVWSPTFLLILLERLDRWRNQLARDLRERTLTNLLPLPLDLRRQFSSKLLLDRNVSALLDSAEPLKLAAQLWPQLALISCWTAGPSRPFVARLQSMFPRVRIQPKGLLATEGVVSIPIEGLGAPVAAVRSHFLEFVDDSGTARMMHQLDEAVEYSVLLTTGGGLWRYRLGDRVRCTGFEEATPLLEFIGRDDTVSDICGEKLNEVFVANALERCCAGEASPAFRMLAPTTTTGDKPRYVLFVDTSGENSLAQRLDSALFANPHYAYARRLGQLAPIELRTVSNAAELYTRHLAELGVRAGAVKPKALDGSTDWYEVFAATGEGQ
jgi:hypothetical protein